MDHHHHHHRPFSLFLLLLHIFFFVKGNLGATITLSNNCDYTIWPGVLPNAGTPDLGSTGFELSSGDSRSFQASPGWSGRLWARTRCGPDTASGKWACVTGDCGSGQLECTGSGATPPATLAEITLGPESGDKDYYDVSLVDGFNVPMVIEAEGGSGSGSGSCLATGCASDLNQHCPDELRFSEGDACKSACGAFGTPEYCCSGAYGSPNSCRPSSYSQMFKLSCPRAYSYAFDDSTSTYTCVDADYTITFCPSLTSQQKSSLDSHSSSSAESGIVFESDNGSGSGLGSLFRSHGCHKNFCVGGGQYLSNASKIANLKHTYLGLELVIMLIFTRAL